MTSNHLGSRLIAAALVLATCTTLGRVEAQFRRGGYTRTSVNVHRNVNVNVNVYHGGFYHYSRWGHPVAPIAAAVATAVVVGAVVASLPPKCAVVMVGAIAYQNCGGVYYQPVYHATTVQYVVVNAPIL
jgi:hypothetical protein